jgi:CopG family transcriptional regulator / antitoxin EndoAI
MPRRSSILSISLPPELSSDLDSVASQERRSRSELVREAVRQYILLSRWKALRQKASLKAIQRGLNEEDVERLIEEERSARRRRH